VLHTSYAWLYFGSGSVTNTGLPSIAAATPGLELYVTTAQQFIKSFNTLG